MAKESEVVEQSIGVVTHYFAQAGVAVVKMEDTLAQGAQVRFHGATTDFMQTVESMEIDHASVARASKGQEIGMKVRERVREGDKVFLV